MIQDVRGRFASGGRFVPFEDDGWGANQDGYDTVEWVARQPWCDGRVGTIGRSYAGATQYRLAPARPPHLRDTSEPPGTATRGQVARNVVSHDPARPSRVVLPVV